MSGQKFTAFWTGYNPTTGRGASPLLGATPSYVDTVVLAFANLFPGNTTCQGFLQKCNSEDQIKEGIASIRAANRNVKILMSIIGTKTPNVGWNTGITDPDQFGPWCAYLAESWGLDGFDIDNEDLESAPGDQFVKAVKSMRTAMPDKILTLDTYQCYRDEEVIKQLKDDLDYINTIAYFYEFEGMTSLVEQYAAIIDPGKISIGVKSAPVGIEQGTSLEDTKKLTAWNPKEGAKYGMTLWNLSIDIKSRTNKPDGAWAKAIHEGLTAQPVAAAV